MLRVGDARRRVVGQLWRLGALQRADHAGEEDHQAVAAGVDHAGLGEDGQQLGAAVDRLLPHPDRLGQDPGEHGVLVGRRGVGVEALAARVRDHVGHVPGHLADDREDRPLGRRADRAVGLIGRAGHRGGQQHRVDELAGTGDQLLRRAADELGEDHAGVAAGAEQRGPGHRADDRVAADVVDVAQRGQAIELGEHGLERERHVVARVAVGDREDVEVVDLLAAGLERGERALDDRPEPAEAGVTRDSRRARQLRTTRLHARRLGGLGDLAGLEAARADVDALGRPVEVDANPLEIRIEAALRCHHGVAAAVAERRALPTRVAYLGHRAGEYRAPAAAVLPWSQISPDEISPRRPRRQRRDGRRVRGRRRASSTAAWRSRSWPPIWPRTPSSRERFVREARAAARLSGHPNVIQVYDVGVHEGVPFMVMELLEGGALSQRVRDGPARPRAGGRLAARDRRRARLRPRPRHRPPRRQALQPAARRATTSSTSPTSGSPGSRPTRPHGHGADPRHRRLPLPRAGARARRPRPPRTTTRWPSSPSS